MQTDKGSFILWNLVVSECLATGGHCHHGNRFMDNGSWIIIVVIVDIIIGTRVPEGLPYGA